MYRNMGYLGKGHDYYGFPDHDRIGAKMIPGITKRLRLSTVEDISKRQIFNA